jgi:hypothetical protein
MNNRTEFSSLRNSGGMKMTSASLLGRVFARQGIDRGLILPVLFLFCVNVVVLSFSNGYEIRSGLFTLTAHGLFRPILLMNACFLIALITRGSASQRSGVDCTCSFTGDWFVSAGRFYAVLIVLVVAVVVGIYFRSTDVNFENPDWTHRHVSAEIQSLGSAWKLFTNPQPDGFYRPLTFLSLWLDYRQFGVNYAGYHVQSIVLHAINSILVALLATYLGFSRKCSLWTGLLFAAAAVSFEPVLWPAARFDLLAAMFTLLALICAVKHFRDSRKWTWALPAALLCYALGVFNKESSYCFPLLLVLILRTHQLWGIQRPGQAKGALSISLVGIGTVLMVLIRIAVFHNLGGYSALGNGQSVHFHLGFRTLTSLLRAVAIPLFGVNTADSSPGWIRILAASFAVLTFGTAVACRGCFGRKEFGLAACMLLALVPVLNIAGWIGSSMLHSRYLYLPSAFFMMLLAAIVCKVRWSVGLLGAFLAVNAAGAVSNVWAYQDMLARTRSLAEFVRADWIKNREINKICLVDLPEAPNGIFSFSAELIGNIARAIPNATIVRYDVHKSPPPGDLVPLTYQWDNTSRMLNRIR